MKENQEYRVHWRKFVTFTFIVGLIVAIFSVISDNLPNLSDGATVLELIISYLAVMLNSFAIWFILAMLVGYIFARSIKEAALLGAIYTISAITFYYVIGHFYTDIPVSVSISISFKEQAFNFVKLCGMSAIGGISGGIVGFLIKKTPYALLILLAGLILQLFVYGTSSWSDIVGIAQNVTFCLMIVSIFIYLVIVKRNDRSKYLGM
ncbi:hypothetical protein [Peribacillus simplex]|uniref:hypothetical protein n=1 Tax=Peribacillus simplex TaxID=1478 RepID=UPI003D27EDCE